MISASQQVVDLRHQPFLGYLLRLHSCMQKVQRTWQILLRYSQPGGCEHRVTSHRLRLKPC